MGTLKQTMSLRRGTLQKHLQSGENFAASVDFVDEEMTTKDDGLLTAGYHLCS